MRIDSYAINLNSNREFKKTIIEHEKENFWIGNNNNQNNITFDNFPEIKNKELLSPINTKPINLEENEDIIDKEDNLKLQILKKMLERLTGKSFQFNFIENLAQVKQDMSKLEEKMNSIMFYNQSGQIQPFQNGWGYEYDYQKIQYEYEKTTFTATGIVNTKDGKEISINISLEMEREFLSYESVSIRKGDAQLIDPLVLNFNGTAAELSSRKFEFDLTSNGSLEYISYLNPGNGFLALDRNNDGKINNGSELFGPTTGNGFKELAKYDDDSNGWIDKNDSIFDKLKVLTFDEKGNQKLFSLLDKNIGAIYLGNIDSLFSLNDINNRTNGLIQNSGIFLKNNGNTGIIQHVDFSV